MDVVEAEGDGGYKALQRDLDGQTKVLLQQGAGQSSHRLRLFEINTGGETNMAFKFNSNTLKFVSQLYKNLNICFL